MMISTRQPEVIVQYDAKGKRVAKSFKDAYAARRFYTAKVKEGASPSVHRVTPPTQTPSSNRS